MDKKNLKNLTGLKVLALIMIYLEHSGAISPLWGLSTRGTEFLFVCSGFLVSLKHSEDWKQNTFNNSFLYLKEKLTVIYPVHFITFSYSVFLLFLQKRPICSTAIWSAFLNIFCLQAWSSNLYVVMDYNGLSWFISCLLFCYFLSPFYIQIISRLKRKSIGLISVILFRALLEYLLLSYPEQFFLL